MHWDILDVESASEHFGFNVIGFLTAALGLGVAARNTVRSMHERDLPFKAVDVDLSDERSNQDMSCMRLGLQTDALSPFSVNVWHMNPPELRGAIASGGYDVVDRFNAAVPFWELSVLPEEWTRVLRGCDLVLTPTVFIHDVVERAVPDCLSLPYPQAAMIPLDVVADRGKWNLPADGVLFVSSFDLASDTSRKNPWGVVDAFKRAFPRPDGQYLVLKVNSPQWAKDAWPDEHKEVLALHDDNSNIIVIDEVIPFRDVLTLYASCDVLVSLHRSEGLGLSLMEAMTYGKPVLATAYSGNMDFCTPQNSCLVDYELIPAVSKHPSYSAESVGPGAEWADPDLGQAAECMRRLAEDEALRTSLGEQARADMEMRRRNFWQGAIWDTIREMSLDPGSVLWERHLDRVDALLDLSWPPYDETAA